MVIARCQLCILACEVSSIVAAPMILVLTGVIVKAAAAKNTRKAIKIFGDFNNPIINSVVNAARYELRENVKIIAKNTVEDKNRYATFFSFKYKAREMAKTIDKKPPAKFGSRKVETSLVWCGSQPKAVRFDKSGKSKI